MPLPMVARRSACSNPAILQYLAEKTGVFLPQEFRARTAVLEWLNWQIGGLGPMTGQLGHFHVIYAGKDRLRHGPLPQRSGTPARRPGQTAGQHAFLAGDEYSIADMASYPWIDVYPGLAPDFSLYPHVKRWVDAIAARPAITRACVWSAKVNPSASSH